MTRYRERRMLAGLALGARLPEQWGSAAAAVDFFDVKADVQAVLALAAPAGQLSFEPARDVLCMHTGRGAASCAPPGGAWARWAAAPGAAAELALDEAPLLFELDYEQAFATKVAQFREVSRFPRIRRDISLTIPPSKPPSRPCVNVLLLRQPAY